MCLETRANEKVSFVGRRPVRLGIDPCDYAVIGRALGEKQLRQLMEDCPPSRRILFPFAVDRYPVTKRDFLAFFFDTAERAGRFPEADYRHWDEIRADQSYVDDAPIVGVSLFEASAYAYSRGGRLLFEAEYEFLLRGRLRSGLVGPGIVPRASPARFDEVVHDLVPVTSADVPAGCRGVFGLFGNARELVVAEGGWDVAEIVPIIKPLGARDRLLHAGARIRVTDAYLSGRGLPARTRNIEPAGFRVAYDLR